MLPLVAGGIAMGLGSLASAFGAKKKKLPSYQELQQMFGAGALAKSTSSMYNMLAASPQFQMSLNQNALAGANLSNSINAGLGKRGLSTSGIGTIASAMGGSAAQFGESALRGGLFGQASDMAQNNMSQLMQAYLATQNMQQQQPNFLESLGGGLLTAGSSLAMMQPGGGKKKKKVASLAEMNSPGYGWAGGGS